MPKSSEPFSICSRAVICLRYSMVFLRLRGFATVAAQKGPPFCDGPSLGRNAAKSFAASKAYDITTRQVVSIHTQHPGNRRSAQSRDHAVVDGIRFGELGQGVSSPGVLAFQTTVPTWNCSYP
jgi:hypothetical protein